MENIQRPDCGRDGRYVWVGWCWKDSLSTMEGMIKDYPAFKPKGGSVFPSPEAFGGALREDSLREAALNPDSGPGCEGDTARGPTMGTVPKSAGGSRLQGAYMGSSPTVYSTSQFINPGIRCLLEPPSDPGKYVDQGLGS